MGYEMNIWLAIALISLAFLIGSATGYYTRSADEGEKNVKSNSNRGGDFKKGYVYGQLMNQNLKNNHF